MITFVEYHLSSPDCVTYLIATIHTRDLSQSKAFKSQTRFCFILVSISLYQGPEAAVVGVTGGRSFACVPMQTIHHGCELLSSNLRHWEGTANSGYLLLLALPEMGSIPPQTPGTGFLCGATDGHTGSVSVAHPFVLHLTVPSRARDLHLQPKPSLE